MKPQAAVLHPRRYALAYAASLMAVAAAIAACSNDTPTANDAVDASARFGKDKVVPSRMVFTSNRDGNYEVYIMNADGSGQTRLTFDRGTDASPVLSPDQTKIAFVSTRSNPQGDIYTMNADGSGVTRITNTTAFNHSPSWSPNGGKLVFSSTRDAADPTQPTPYSNWELYSMNANGSNVVRLTNNTTGEFFPAWAPDNKRIAFASDRDHQGQNSLRDLYVMNDDGSSTKRLTNQSGQLIGPSWDQNSKRIAYHVYPPSAAPGIYILNLSNGVSTRLTFGSGADDAWVSFSPDGSKLAYTHYSPGAGHVWTMTDNGNNKTQITSSAGYDLGPRWAR